MVFMAIDMKSKTKIRIRFIIRSFSRFRSRFRDGRQCPVPPIQRSEEDSALHDPGFRIFQPKLRIAAPGRVFFHDGGASESFFPYICATQEGCLRGTTGQTPEMETQRHADPADPRTMPSGRFHEEAEIIPYELDAGNTDERTCS